MNTVHELKILPGYFEDVASGRKTFEVRKDDRKPRYEEGDELILREWEGGEYTGRKINGLVRYVLRSEDYCKEGYCIMAIEVTGMKGAEEK